MENFRRPGEVYGGQKGEPLVMDGYNGHVTYIVDTVYVIDGNLASLRRGHPDINLLLDARRLVSTLNAMFPPD